MGKFDAGEFMRSMKFAQEEEAKRQALGKITSVGQGLPFYFGEVSAATASMLTNGFPVNVSGNEFHFLREGSAETVRIDVEYLGKVVRMAPGDSFRAPFDKLVLRTSPDLSTSIEEVHTGYSESLVRFCVVTKEGATYQQAAVRPNRDLSVAIYNPAYNSLINIPTQDTDGISLVNVERGIRALISSGDASNIAGGIGVWWVQAPTQGGIWCETPIQVTLPTGRNQVALPDELTLLPVGRAYLELRSYTDGSGGASLPNVYLFGC